ncbi:bifunctional 3-(3-hydroxy-phenyl)propionate/3-hydroxycinnamic acid hydroxylase [Pseudomonas sp. MWU13-2105]|uniref:bifunctional 3-(3-hydroxy-phenyl)propionate/3-hydroxycinnamic acid hydroxylase n=1 Tax=Pseudomonas sp. MWU13-2105 TaxID=2935074 RepID=UPI00200D4373|nr:bifunctional 3-(3-hydroxy-phenyl)propionate/3-hydroxycinnamic acid hydroxylase [Pseudomonas sp. MWU13-2105]
MNEISCDVAIVGLGPTGVVAAILLGMAGLRVHVIERRHEVYEIPRAIALDHEIMRIFQQLGTAQAILPYCEPFTPSEFYGVNGELIRRMTMIAPPYPMGYTPSMVFTQPPVEQVLRERLAQLKTVTTAFGYDVQDLIADAQGASLATLSDQGEEQVIEARWVIACDGGGSTTRGLLGIDLQDLDFDEPWLVVDVKVNERGLAKLPDVSVQYCEPERPCTLVIGPGNHRRWEISLKPGEDPAQVATEAGTWSLLSRWLSPEDGTLWRQASYRFHALVAEDWRQGCVFLAGDAAHMQPPFLGQGMCQGIRDASNLAWKLIAVHNGDVQGEAAEMLLDSYGIERKAHVSELTGRLKQIGATICERDTAKAMARDLQLLAECDGVVKDTPRQDILPPLRSGLLSTHTSEARGCLFVQPRLHGQNLRDTSLMDELYGYGWRLVMDARLQNPVELAGLTLVKPDADQCTDAEGVLTQWMEHYQCHAVLVRPDHYVFGTAETDSELHDLLSQWRTALRL